MDPIPQELERIAKELNIEFLYANLNEANIGVDELQTFPVLVYVNEQNDRSTYTEETSGQLIRTVPVFCLLLTVDKNVTIDYSTPEIDPVIESMRTLGKRVISQINKSSLSDPTKPVITFETNKIYRKFDYHLFGVSLAFNWAVYDRRIC